MQCWSAIFAWEDHRAYPSVYTTRCTYSYFHDSKRLVYMSLTYHPPSVRVIDPTLSYCELSTEFAIEILGPTYAEVEPIPYIIVVLCAILIVALIVGLSYLRFTGIFRLVIGIKGLRAKLSFALKFLNGWCTTLITVE